MTIVSGVSTPDFSSKSLLTTLCFRIVSNDEILHVIRQPNLTNLNVYRIVTRYHPFLDLGIPSPFFEAQRKNFDKGGEWKPLKVSSFRHRSRRTVHRDKPVLKRNLSYFPWTLGETSGRLNPTQKRTEETGYQKGPRSVTWTDTMVFSTS